VVTGERRPSPDWQVRKMLEVLRDEGVPFEAAWYLAVRGQVCDSYRSARGSVPQMTEVGASPPHLHPSTGPKRCAGCRFAEKVATSGPATCTLYGVDVFAGVAWPHRTLDREQWRAAIGTALGEWRRAYDGQPSPVSAVLDAIRLRAQETGSGGRRHA
jgi:hypothetical protein